MFDEAYFNDPEVARVHLEAIRWGDTRFCPHCGSTTKTAPLKGKSHRPGLYKCYGCKGHFTVTVGTVFERSKIPLHIWFRAVYLLCSSKKGISSHQLHRMLGVTYKTAWFMTHRIREAFKEGSFAEGLGGAGKVVEADETYFGDADEERTSRSTRGYANKRAVVSLVERGGNVRSFHFEKIPDARSVREVLVRNVSRDSVLSTDESALYKKLGREFAKHEKVNHSLREYRRGAAHTNTIEGYFSIFKRGMKGVYQHCAEKHLHRYLAEFDFRYNHRAALGIDDFSRMAAAMERIEGKRLTYRQPHAA